MTTTDPHSHTLTLPEAIRVAILRTGMTLGEVAELLHVHPKTVGRWQRGTTAPTFDHVVRLAQLSGFPLEFFAQTIPSLSEAGPITRYPFPHALPPVLGQLDLFEDAPRSNPLPFVAAA